MCNQQMQQRLWFQICSNSLRTSDDLPFSDLKRNRDIWQNFRKQGSVKKYTLPVVLLPKGTYCILWLLIRTKLWALRVVLYGRNKTNPLPRWAWCCWHCDHLEVGYDLLGVSHSHWWGKVKKGNPQKWTNDSFWFDIIWPLTPRGPGIDPK